MRTPTDSHGQHCSDDNISSNLSIVTRYDWVTRRRFKEVNEEEKAKLVGNVFTKVAPSYDLMNDMMSGGLHRLWKDRLVSKLHPFPGMNHLDVAGGTGDIAFRILDNINSVSHRALKNGQAEGEDDTKIYVLDINPNMLAVGRMLDSRCLQWVEGDAEALTFEESSMDGYTIAFGIRNVTHIERALDEAYRVLKRGGRFLCMELSHVDTPLLNKCNLRLLLVFSHPSNGEVVAGDRDSYQYLVESIRQFPKQEKFARMIAEAGFQKVEYENLVGGVVAIHTGLKL
ncbi:unnamed protein product [Spirodela intermedia]|uniref:2-methoxy-6-polyprenyl-1,4-benzoquinol methylase, mitochondrial n=1 Tax=Spirodela intermedia TaxID=51605 RepID=A0A7I8IWG5_SPIIN|nr:unnamed protein product [Spirodela intermedia]CAA6662111.1 unnamed protein product [Spirodela intermedia]